MIRTVCILALIFALLPAIANAQTQDNAASRPLGELFVGYSYSAQGRPTMHGWHSSLLSQLTDRVGILVDLSGHYWSPDVPVFGLPLDVNAGLHAYRFGPQIKMVTGRTVTTFVHVLVGGNYLHVFGGGDIAGLHGFAAAVGGGADWHLNDTISLRIPQYDYSLMWISGGNSSGFRISTGLVFKLR